jgi:hypothetical protein
MSRTIALLGLAQAATVICGFFGLAIILRHDGYPGEPLQAGSNFVIYHWSYLTLFLRRLGVILLVVPVAFLSRSPFSPKARAWNLAWGRRSQGRAAVLPHL